VPPQDLARDIAGGTASHRRVLDTLTRLSDSQARSSSLLPGWTIGHVVTHLARNADSHVRLLSAAERGEVTDQYEGGAAGRAAAIEAGAGRAAAALVADLRDSIAALEDKWHTASEVAWQGRGRGVTGEYSMTTLPFRRWGEVEIHHRDLGLGYTSNDWPDDFVRIELARLKAEWASRQPMGMTELPASVLALGPAERVAWLTGRLDVEGTPPAGIFA